MMEVFSEKGQIIKAKSWDRKATVVPNYLHILRSPGTWRSRDYISGWSRYSGGISGASQSLRDVHFYDEGKRFILDAGCGNSADALIAVEASEYIKGYKIDLFPPFEDRCMYNHKTFDERERKAGIKFIQADICEKLPLPSNHIDTIVCNAMIDLLKPQERQMFYKEAYRLLNPGGLLAVSIIQLKAGYGTVAETEHFSVQDVGFVLIRGGLSFVAQKPTPTKKGTTRNE